MPTAPMTRRQPRLWFYTGNSEKWLQARLLSDEYRLLISQSKSESGKVENYGLGRQEMLDESLREAVRRTGGESLVFVEDTTARIEALSGEGDFPGLETKEWFDRTSFGHLDSILKELGNDRRASVRSDIALYVPRLGRSVRFEGVTDGWIAEAEPPRRLHPLYQWLTTETFNGWFVPNGSDRVLGLMDLDEASHFDFRERALRQMFERVQEYTAAINLSTSAYRVLKSERSAITEPIPGLFLEPPRIVVVGRTCAGKSTFAQYASMHHNFLHIEASSVLRGLPWPEDLPQVDSVADSARYAHELLNYHGRAAVAEHILAKDGDTLRISPFVISGLRTIEEIDYLKGVLDNLFVVLVESPANQRWERHIKRNRPGRVVATRAEFRSADRSQDSFGLLPVAKDLADLVLSNGDDLDHYLNVVDSTLVALRDPSSKVSRARSRSRLPSRLARALRVLEENGELTLPEIEARAGLGDHNASRFFGSAPGVVEQITRPSGRALWRLTPSGEAYLRVLSRREN